MRREIRIAGFGGQGVVTMGTILAVAAGLHEGLEVAQMQSYGPEARGGACRSDVVISDEPIDYIKPLGLDLFIALSSPALERYWSEVQRERTLVLVDSTLVPKFPDHAPPVLAVEGTRLAEEEFRDRVMANMIMLGAGAAYTGWIRLGSLETSLAERISGHLLGVAKNALRRGFELGSPTPFPQNSGDPGSGHLPGI